MDKDDSSIELPRGDASRVVGVLNGEVGGCLGDTGARISGDPGVSVAEPPPTNATGPDVAGWANGDSGERGVENGDTGACRGDMAPKGDEGGGLGEEGVTGDSWPL